MKKSKKMLSWVSLGVLLLSNVVTPWTYAEIEMDENENFDILGDILENYEGIDDENGADEDNHEVLDVQSDIDEDENFYGENSLQRENDSYLILTKDENLALNTSESDTYNWKDCYDYEYNDAGALSISNYKCDSRDIRIPTSEYGNDKFTAILDGTFAGKIIESIEMPEKFSVHYEAFSGAIFSGNITLEENDGQYFYDLQSIIVAKDSTLTVKQCNRLYRAKVYGNLIYDFGGVSGWCSYLLNNSLIEGSVIINGLNGNLGYSFNNSIISEGGLISLGEGIENIENSFGSYENGCILDGNIRFPSTLRNVKDSFNYSKINTQLNFPNLIEKFDNAFNSSYITSNIVITGNNESLKFDRSSFSFSEITGDIVFSGRTLDITNFNPKIINGNIKIINSCFANIEHFLTLPNSIIDGDVEFINSNIENVDGNILDTKINGNLNIEGNINTSSPGRMRVNVQGDLSISGNNVYLPMGGGVSVGGDFLITGDSIYMSYGMGNIKVGKSVKVRGNSVTAQYGSWRSANIFGDFVIEGETINLGYSFMDRNDVSPFVGGNLLISGNEITMQYTALSNLVISGNLLIFGETCNAGYTALDRSLIYGDFKLPSNINLFPGALDGTTVYGKTILDVPYSGSLKYNIAGDLQINNSDNALADTFSGISVGRNIYLSGEISKLGANAYSFSSGNIQPITLSATFSTGDIGEGAFCMEGKPLVVAYTKKKLTQAEKEYLRTHACLNAMGTYTLTFKSGDRTETLEYDGRNIDQIPVRERTGYEFLGWHETGTNEIFDFTGTEILEDKTFYARWKANTYAVSFDTNGGNEISPISVDCDTLFSGVDLPKPTRECNEFSGWENLPETMPAHDITLKAIWNYTCSKSSGGGGAKKTETTTRETAVETPTENEHNSADEQKSDIPETSNTPANEETTSNQVISVTQEVSEDGTIEAVVETIKIKNTDIVATVRTEVNSTNSSSRSSSSATHTKEENDAYSFAKSNGITTTSSIDDAKMNTELTRIQMAKMLSNFAINVLGQEPDPEKGIVKFDDVTNKMDKQYDNAVTKAYQLGIMGQNVKNNEFRPNDTVTRAEFASALSRLLYHTEEGNYKGTGKYYVPHVAKLYNEGIINKADPKIKEKRGYVMTMLMRTVE